MRLPRTSRSRTSAVNSSTVSNCDAVWTNSSSSSGRDRSLTSTTLTVTSTGVPLSSPPTSSVEKVTSSPADRPVTASSRPSSRTPEPTVYGMPLASAPSMGSPSLSFATRSIVRASPSAAARSTSVVVAKRSRSASTCSVTSSSVTSASSTFTVMSARSGRSSSGRTSSSAVISMSSPSANLVRSISGWLSGWTLVSSSAWRYQSGSAALTASLRTASRPTRWSTMAAGTLPLRKPGTWICPPICL